MSFISSGAASFMLQFQVSPIIMTGGIASNVLGGSLPVLAISQAMSFAGGLLTLGDTLSVDDYFAYFEPLPGGTLIDQQIGMYPFANQTVAANAVIQQPLSISMLMICPAGRGGGYASKMSNMMSIQAAYDSHNRSGGMYDIMTPSFVYSNLVMTSMTDVSNRSTKQPQNAYKLDFLKPLLTLEDAAGAYNSLMGLIAGGGATDGTMASSIVGSSTSPSTLLSDPGGLLG